MGAEEQHKITREEYFIIEKEDGQKYEFHDGEIFAMAGGSNNHALIGTNLTKHFWNSFDDDNSDCFAINSDARLAIPKHNRYFHPDGMIICGDIISEPGRNDSVTNPTVIFEILSDSTEDYDRGAKSIYYRQIETLKQYVLVSQNKAEIEVWTKTDKATWSVTTISGMDSNLDLGSVGASVSFAQVYDRVDFKKAG